MDSVEARRILELYRPGQDDADPFFAEALAEARRDPQLGRWLEEQSRLHGAIRRKLTEVGPPVGLKERILDTGRLAADSGGFWRDRWGMSDPARRRPSFAFAAAAAAVLAVVMFAGSRLSSRRGGDDLEAWRGKMVAFVSVDYRLDLHEEIYAGLRRRLVEGGYPSIAELPPRLAALHLEGGSLLDWQGHKVTLVCMEAEEDHDAWLFLADRAAIAGAPVGETLRIALSGRMATASWSRAGLVFLLVTEGDEAAVRRYLDPVK